jgi:pimeloyl-ACP methyl ester carboxylesterase
MVSAQSHFLEGAPRIHYLEWNRAAPRTIVLLHGNSANAHWWEWFAESMPSSYHVLALDHRGHGDSGWVSPPAYQPRDYASDVARFIEGKKLDRPFVVGHSMGGIVTLAFAANHPELTRATAAIDIAVKSSHGRDRYLRRLKSLPTVVYPDLATAKARFRLMPDEGGIPHDRIAKIAEMSLSKVEGGYSLKFDRESFFGSDGIPVMDTIRGLRVPTLLVRAERSRIMTADASEAAASSNQNVKLVTIPNAHHHVLLEKPDELAHVIAGFLDTID